MGGESDDVPRKENKRRKPTKRIRIPVKEGRGIDVGKRYNW
jgi:hypothetical protein